MQPRPGRMTQAVGRGVLLGLLVCWPVVAGAVGVDLILVPETTALAPGEEFDVAVVVAEGSSFNGFDLEICYDTGRLTYLGQPTAGLSGPLMAEACPGSPFHLFAIAPDSSALEITYVLLCSGVEVTGPGEIYTLRFRAKGPPGEAALGFGADTRFFAAGIEVGPVRTTESTVVVGQVTGVEDSPRAPIPHLMAAPNPFNPETRLVFSLHEPGPVRLRIYDARGRRVRTLIDGVLPAGERAVVWRGGDDQGRHQPGGVYFCELLYLRLGRGDTANCKLVLVP